MTTRQNLFLGGLAVLLFLGALGWARERDPFVRDWLTLKTSNHESFKYVTVLPKPLRRYPVIIYAHGGGGSLMEDGQDLRQMAELGLAVVSLEYNRTNEDAFMPQFRALLLYLGRQKWADTSAITWVGFSLGADRMLDFALQHPELQPQILVQLSGAGLSESQSSNQLTSLRCPLLLVHGERDEVFPVTDTERLASILRTEDLPVELKILPGVSHDTGPDRGVVFRCIGEYCLTRLVGKNAWQSYHSIAQWQAGVMPLWLFWLPTAAWVVGWFAWSRRLKLNPNLKVKLRRHEAAFRWFAVLLATWALAETAIHLLIPCFPINDQTLAVARRFLIRPNQSADFEFLAAQPAWRGLKLRVLLTQVQLAGYNRKLVNWRLDDKDYQDYVLSPVITGKSGEEFNWRRSLWEEFYPRIRRENSPEDAARIIVRHLRERITVVSAPDLSRSVPTIWLKQVTDKAGFETIYVAALRSVGVPARINPEHQTELLDSGRWRPAPRPSVLEIDLTN